MRTIRVVSSARARKLRRLGERVWWHVGFEALVWDISASRRKRRYCPKVPGRISRKAKNLARAMGFSDENLRDRFVINKLQVPAE